MVALPDDTGAKRALYLEDLSIGDRFQSGEHLLDAAQIKAFALQFDPQPFHTDEEAAKNTFFGSLAASGWHTAALTMKLLVESGIPLAEGVIGSGGELQWPKPTRPGDVLHVVSEVLDITPSRSKPGRAMVTMRCRTLNQRGEVLQYFTPKLLVHARPA
ncbi:acyl dehydratase [Variovorax paradoxus]|jgi:acyl dehydratase|uniref:MaoC family dehydratase n=1 Tax=Variovorax paradoxus TaxID=34073 RepID=UPI0027871C7F|nr:MaoC family dehydratase [Variovorax paradoxus]MDP9933375.1 acyl dehydratase [Variovorax paradoxus]MDQ0023330.1 acyl dehydratase [Variovorax paradoxus]